MDGPVETNICVATEYVFLEAMLKALSRRRALLMVSEATDLFAETSGITPITASMVTVATRRAAADLWLGQLPKIMLRLR